MLEKLVYFISSFSLLFWTVFSNKKSLDESLAYVWVVTILLAVELVISIIWEKNRKKRQGIYIMLFLMNIEADRFLLCIKLQSFCKRFKVFDFDFYRCLFSDLLY